MRPNASMALITALLVGEGHHLMDGQTRFNARGIRGTPAPIPPKGTPKGKKVGRNDQCPCGKGLKYKRCCLPKQDEILAAYRRGELVPGDNGLMKPAT